MYQIPRNVETRFTFFEGFGWFELGFTLAGAVLGLLLGFIISAFSSSIFPRAIAFIFGPGLAYFLTKPTPDGSILELLKKLKRWGERPRRYFYLRGENE